MNNLTVRAIDLIFVLNSGSFVDPDNPNAGSFNTVTVKGLRVRATITKSGSPSMNQLQANIYGMTPDVAGQLSSLGKQIAEGNQNYVTLMTYDNVISSADFPTPAVAFSGYIDQAWLDLQNAPEVGLTLSAKTGLYEALAPAPALSYPGSADVATIIGKLATQMGYQFEPNGVSYQLATPYFSGSAREQVLAAAKAANVNVTFDDAVSGAGAASGATKGTIAIWPIGGARLGVPVPVSVNTGMIGYPTWTQNGLQVKMLYNSNIRQGGQISLQSVVPNTSGPWNVTGVTHELECITPSGAWCTTVECVQTDSDTPNSLPINNKI